MERTSVKNHVGFYWLFRNWWSSLSFDKQNAIYNEVDSVTTLSESVGHELFGTVHIDTKLHADLFVSRRLCDLSQLDRFNWIMQKLLYETLDPTNAAYVQYYIAAMPKNIPSW